MDNELNLTISEQIELTNIVDEDQLYFNNVDLFNDEDVNSINKQGKLEWIKKLGTNVDILI